MEKFLFSALLLAATTSTAQAQISRGTTLFGGSIGYGSSTSKNTYDNPSIPVNQREVETTSRNFSISPSGGLFVTENLALGLSVGFNSHKYTSPYYTGLSSDMVEQVSKSNSFNVAPFLRYYYLPVENFGLYGQLSAGYSRRRSTTESDEPGFLTQKNKGNGAFVNVTPALVFFPTNKLGLELTMGSIGYSRASSKPENLQSGQFNTESQDSSFGATFGLNNLTLGASFYVGRQ